MRVTWMIVDDAIAIGPLLILSERPIKTNNNMCAVTAATVPVPLLAGESLVPDCPCASRANLRG